MGNATEIAPPPDVREIFAAARAAVADGLDIVRRAQAQFDFAERSRRRHRKQPARSQSEEVTYYLTEEDRRNVEAVNTMLAMARLTTKVTLQQASYRDAGIYLQRLRRDRDLDEWERIIPRECRLSPRRACELIDIATGRKSLVTSLPARWAA